MASSSQRESSPNRSSLLRNNFRFGRQKSRESRESSDSDDEDLFDSDKIKTRLMSMWNNVRHGFVVPMKTHFHADTPIWLLGRLYHAKSHDFSGVHSNQRCKTMSMDEFQRDFNSLIWLTYRREFAQLDGSTLTSDCGWGCMLRSGQMMLATGLMYHFLRRDVVPSIGTGRTKVLELHFADWRTTGRCHSREQDHYYRTILRFFGDLEDEERCPFSLHRLVLFGQQAGKQAGDWYGPASVAHILKIAMECGSHPLLHDVNIYVAQDCTVYKDEVEQLCTTCRTHGRNCSKNRWQSVIILVPVRLGGEATNPIYIPCLKSLFTLDQCIGIIGGRPKHSLYFVGFQDDKLIYLDPHYCQSVVDVSQDDFPTDSFHSMNPRKVSFKKMDPSCTIGFYCGSREEFETFCKQGAEVLRPPMQRGDYPMFTFSTSRLPNAPENSIKSARLSESLIDKPESPHEAPTNPPPISCSPPEDYVIL